MRIQDIMLIGKVPRKRKRTIRIKFISFILITLFIANISFLNLNLFTNKGNLTDLSEIRENQSDLASSSQIDDVLQDPFTIHFEDFGNLLQEKYKQSLFGFSTYFRNGDENGNLLDNITYSIDNLLTLKYVTSGIGQFSLAYNNLKDSAFWYNGNESLYEYGFLHSINGTTQDVKDDTRYLIDNLTPIYYFLDYLTKPEISAYISLINPQVKEILQLVNSTQFWDNTNIGFYTSNSSSLENKIVFDNLYTITACSLINRTLEIDQNIRNRAFELANITMNKLLDVVWDNDYLGFDRFADSDWTAGGLGSTYKYLDTNAMGIYTLLNMWQNTGLNESSPYFKNASLLYQKLNDALWNNTYNLYEYGRIGNWGLTVDIEDRKIDLTANAYMMQAILKFYDVTGNITYYNKAIEMFEALENWFFDENVNAYNYSVGSIANGNKNLNANLRLLDTLVYAKSIYNQTFVRSSYNVSELVPNYIIGQDTLKLISNYSIEKVIDYYNPKTLSMEQTTRKNYITDSNITYLFRYPNTTIFKTIEDHIEPGLETGSVAETTIIECGEDVNFSLNGTYFLIDTPSESYYVWINMSEYGAPDPSIADRTPIQISTISEDDTNATVADEIATILQNYGGDGEVFQASVDGETPWNISVTNVELGTVPDAQDGAIGDRTNFTFYVTTQGQNRTLHEHTITYDIPENLPLSNSFDEEESQGLSYSIYVYANSTYFDFTYTTIGFNVISGLENQSIVGLDSSGFFQGETINITLPIKSIRSGNITLNASLEGDVILNSQYEYNFTASETTNVPFNITVKDQVLPGFHDIEFTFEHNGILYLKIIKTIFVKNAFNYSNFLYSQRLVSGSNVDISFNLNNLLQNSSQSLNISFSSDYINDYTKEITLQKKETREVSFSLELIDDIDDDNIDIEFTIKKGAEILDIFEFSVEIISKLELIRITFPERITQAETAYCIIIIENNQQTSQDFVLIINDQEIDTPFTSLVPGRNRIVAETLPSINPYEIGTKSFEIEIREGTNQDDQIIVKEYFSVQIQLSTINLLLFYVIPIIIPVGIVIYYKNKELKAKLLRR